MKLLGRTTLLVFALLSGFTALRADVLLPVTDPAQVARHYHQVAARPEFAESGEPIANTRFEDVVSQWFKGLGAKIGSFKYASKMPAFESFLMTMLVALAVAVLFYVMLRLTRRRTGFAPEPREDSTGEKTFRAPEFYDGEIQRAIHAADWHTAWLAAWRQFLSRLEHRNLVEADRTRTNREYLRQLAGRALPGTALAQVTKMVDAYDRFIYGRVVIGEAEWNTFQGQIGEATLLLHLDDKNGSHVS